MSGEQHVRRLAALVSADEYERFEARAAANERSVAAELRLAVRAWLATEAKGAA